MVRHLNSKHSTVATHSSTILRWIYRFGVELLKSHASWAQGHYFQWNKRWENIPTVTPQSWLSIYATVKETEKLSLGRTHSLQEE